MPAARADSTGRHNTSTSEVLMGRPAGWMKELTGRSLMKSPGAPSLRREVERTFWVEIATGITTEAAAARVGVSSAVGTRWFRHRGGMPIDLSPATGRYLSFREREEIVLFRAQGQGVRSIARELGRAPSTISRELRRNAVTRGGKLEYRASVAQWKAELVAQRRRPPSSRPTSGCAITSRTVSQVMSAVRTGAACTVRRPAHGTGGTSHTERTVRGCRRGVPSRSRSA